ncbi:MAG: SBBP repeat-containing protein [Gemmatimonadota bacterium]|nr:SBBP repeat-containing protein [Gemmatimonadota bacterium]MDH5283140.1 SBBP repeat-containing protein [Gemmatimonadota bacterium]
MTILYTALAVGAFGAGCQQNDDPGGNNQVGPVASVRVTPNPLQVHVGDSAGLTAVALDSRGTPVPGTTTTWSSIDPAVATVSSSGVVLGKALGNSTIQALVQSISGSAAVSVVPQPTGGPTIGMATYLGGTATEMIRDLAVDPQGNLVMTGSTHSDDFPTTPGVLGPTLGCCSAKAYDAFVVKMSPAGSVLWSTFLGGPNYERGYAIETDAQGFIFVAGRGGAGLPSTAGTFQPNFGGGNTGAAYGAQDGFICKITPDGKSIVWCSYFGTGDNGILRDIAVDDVGDVYVGGGFTGTGFPSSWFTNSYQKTPSQLQDLVVAKIKGDGSQVIWATYLGGSGREHESVSVRVDGQHNVYVLSTTESPDMPLANAADGSLNGPSDLYLAKLSPNGSTLLYGTYVGGSGGDVTETHGLWLDAQGNAFIGAQTTSSDLPTSALAFQKQYGGGPSDAAVWKFSPSGALLAATYLGGTGGDGIEGITLGPNGDVYISGFMVSPNPPSPVLGTPGAGADVFAARLSPDLSTLRFSLKHGGSGSDNGRGVIVDGQVRLFVGGQTDSPNFPTLNAIQPTMRGTGDALLMRIDP